MRLKPSTREELRIEIRNGIKYDVARLKYNISKRQFRYYLQEEGLEPTTIEEKMGEIDPETFKEVDLMNEQKQEEKPKQKEQVEEPKEQNTPISEAQELEKKELFNTPNELDPNKNYCGTCFNNGKIIEILGKPEKCPNCNEEIIWEQ